MYWFQVQAMGLLNMPWKPFGGKGVNGTLGMGQFGESGERSYTPDTVARGRVCQDVGTHSQTAQPCSDVKADGEGDIIMEDIINTAPAVLVEGVAVTAEAPTPAVERLVE